MKKSWIYLCGLVLVPFCISTTAFSQFSVRAGVNFAKQLKAFPDGGNGVSYVPKTMNGYQIGVMYQGISKMGLGIETGALLLQKGTFFTLSTDSVANLEGYADINVVEVPLNLKYVIRFGGIGAYATAGVYGGYAFSGKVTSLQEESGVKTTFPNSLNERIDFGYGLSTGIELYRKIQLGVTWSNSLLETLAYETYKSEVLRVKNKNRQFAVHLSYFF